MAFVVTPYVIIAAVTAGVALLVAFFAWRRRHASGGAALAWLMLAVAIWAAATACEYAAVTANGKLFWAKVEYIGVLSSPVLYLLFALEYNRLERWLTRRTVALLFAIPVATLLLAFTNAWHHLIWTSITPIPDANNLALYGHGPVFWLSVVGYSYLLMLIATVLFIRAALRLPGLFRRQIAMIIVAALAPWVVNALYVTGQSPMPGLELTPLVMVFTGIIFAWAIFGFHLLTVAPVARQMLIETMAEGMVVLDEGDRVVDINPAARQLVAAPAAFGLGAPVFQLLPDWPDWDARYWRNGVTSAEVAFGAAGRTRYLKVTMAPLRSRRGKLIGRLITMHDITARRQTEAALREQNDYLKALQHTDMELVGQLELTSLLENIVRRAGQLVGTDAGYLDLVDPETRRLKPQVGIGALAESLDHPAAPGEGVAGMVWQSGQPLVVDDYDAWRGRIGGFTRGTLKAVVGVPLRVRDEVVGVLGLGYPAGSPHTFTPERVELLTQFASLAAIAISNARLYDQVQREKLYFESLLANSPAATAIIDLAGRITSWNPAAEAIFGYSQAEAIGRRADELVATDVTDFSPYLLKIRQARPDLVATNLAGNQVTNFVKQYAEFGLPYPVVGFNLNTADAWAAGEGNLGGIWPTVWHHDLQTPGSQAFVAAFMRKYNKRPENHAWISYVALKSLVAQAVTATRGVDTNQLIAYYESQAEFDILKARKAYFRSWDHQLMQEAFPYTVKPRGQAKDKQDFLQFGEAVPAPNQPLELLAPTREENACKF